MSAGVAPLATNSSRNSALSLVARTHALPERISGSETIQGSGMQSRLRKRLYRQRCGRRKASRGPGMERWPTQIQRALCRCQTDGWQIFALIQFSTSGWALMS